MPVTWWWEDSCLLSAATLFFLTWWRRARGGRSAGGSLRGPNCGADLPKANRNHWRRFPLPRSVLPSCWAADTGPRLRLGLGRLLPTQDRPTQVHTRQYAPAWLLYFKVTLCLIWIIFPVLTKTREAEFSWTGHASKELACLLLSRT